MVVKALDKAVTLLWFQNVFICLEMIEHNVPFYPPCINQSHSRLLNILNTSTFTPGYGKTFINICQIVCIMVGIKLSSTFETKLAQAELTTISVVNFRFINIIIDRNNGVHATGGLRRYEPPNHTAQRARTPFKWAKRRKMRNAERKARGKDN